MEVLDFGKSFSLFWQNKEDKKNWTKKTPTSSWFIYWLLFEDVPVSALVCVVVVVVCVGRISRWPLSAVDRSTITESIRCLVLSCRSRLHRLGLNNDELNYVVNWKSGMEKNVIRFEMDGWMDDWTVYRSVVCRLNSRFIVLFFCCLFKKGNECNSIAASNTQHNNPLGETCLGLQFLHWQM